MEKTSLSMNDFSEKLRSGEKNFSNIVLQNVDFTGMNLSKINFSGSNLSNSNFSGSDLSEADFSSANLARCQFKGTILRETNFEKSNLEWAIFTGAIFENTNFHKANLMWAHLCKSDLMRANISEAIINWSCLADSQLSVGQLAQIPSEIMKTVNLTYGQPQSGKGSGVYGTPSSEKPTLIGYASGAMSGGEYSGGGEEDHEGFGYEGRQAQSAFGYGAVSMREAAPKPLRRILDRS
ncbi:MAG TPA: pentapeptide repeat-containing protein [archaeon]|nr:pentapeptide repeat-containing protein [archaeon]